MKSLNGITENKQMQADIGDRCRN